MFATKCTFLAKIDADTVKDEHWTQSWPGRYPLERAGCTCLAAEVPEEDLHHEHEAPGYWLHDGALAGRVPSRW